MCGDCSPLTGGSGGGGELLKAGWAFDPGGLGVRENCSKRKKKKLVSPFDRGMEKSAL